MNNKNQSRWRRCFIAFGLIAALTATTCTVFADDTSGDKSSLNSTAVADSASTADRTGNTEISDTEKINPEKISTGDTTTGNSDTEESDTGDSGDTGTTDPTPTPDPDPEPEPEPQPKLGWITENGHTYYYDRENHFVTGTRTISGKKYYFNGEGFLQYGVLKIGKKYYYADGKGVIRTAKGFFSYKGKRYYAQKGGALQAGRTFTLSKKKYRAAGNGQIKTGVYKWGKYYYYSSAKGVLRTEKGRFRWNGNTYYAKKGGKLVTGKLMKSGKYYYSFQKNGQARRSAFKYKKVTIYPNSKTGAISKAQIQKARRGTGPCKYKKYILIDISSQTLKYYVNGTVKLSSAIVTGGPGTRTPTGTYTLNRKSRNVNLTGADYVSHVDYWLPFIGQAYGMHDATWRSSFGGSIYKYAGSHGCVNMPYAKAKKLFGMVSVGTKVVIRN